MKITNINILLIFVIFLVNCKMGKNEGITLNELTINQIHQDYREGRYNSRDLVSAYLDRIAKYDKFNAISMTNPNALVTAKELDDEYLRSGLLRPLHGIPVIVKDNINVKGLPTTAGSNALKNYIPIEDAFIISKLKEAGAIVIAKSNMAEWAFSPMHTESSTLGTTSNPYSPDHVPAGSSGGTAAAIAMNFGTIGLGTDTGNSIRGPSSHCALVGFRTTLGLVSRTGIVPLYLRNDVVGPMCRTVEDATKVLAVIAGFDEEDPITSYSKGKIPQNYPQFLQSNALSGARVGVLRQLTEDIHPEVSSLFENALSDLITAGATVIDPVDVKDFEILSENQWCASFKEDLETFLKDLVRMDSLQNIGDVIEIGSDSKFAATRLERNAANTGRWSNPEIECLDAYSDSLRIAFRLSIEQVMDSLELDALVYPTWNFPPARIDRFAEEYKGDNSQIISPHTGQPAFTVPMGYTDVNLPAGLQFLGRMYDEEVLVGLVYGYELATRHRRTP